MEVTIITDEKDTFMEQMFAVAAKKTKEETGEKYETWIKHALIDMNITKAISETTSIDEIFDSFIVFRIAELHNLIAWIWKCVLCGAYHQAIRELRYVFDSMLQAFYLDDKYPDANKSHKLVTLKKIDSTLFGRRLIDRIPLEPNKKLKKMYSDLSKYVHPTHKELSPIFKKGLFFERILFMFQQDFFNECQKLTNRTLDAVYYIILNRFPDARTEIKKHTPTINSLKELGCTMTLELLKK